MALFKRMLFTLFFLSISNYYAQTNYKIDGVVKENGKALQGAVVSINNFNGEKVKDILTVATGTFSFALKADEEYTIIVTKEGYISVKLLYSTIGMSEDEAKKLKGSSNPEIILFPLPSEPKLLLRTKEFVNKPLASCYFSSDDVKMICDDDEYNSMLEKLKKLEQDAFEEKNKDALAAQKETKYKTTIASADKEFDAKNYAAAKALYTEAAALKPQEQYPKDKVNQCSKLISEIAQNEKQAKEKEINDKYYAVIAKADKALAAKDYVGAKQAYSEASGIKATEQYPKDKIKEIDALTAAAAAKDKAEKDKLAREKDIADKYNAAIAKGDAAMFSKNYTAAKTAYAEAMAFKPSEQYPKDKIAEADKLITEAAQKDKEAKEKEISDKYNAAISRADKLLAAKDYKAAQIAYTDANSVKPNEQYPKDKLAEITKIIAENEAKDKAAAEAAAKEKERLAKEKEINDKYAAAITKADAAFATKKYSEAKTAYNEALAIKPSETQLKDKIAECDKFAAEAERLAKEKATAEAAEKERLKKEEEKRAFEKKYQQIIATADSALFAKNFDLAKTSYSTAIAMKTEDNYPKEQLKKVEANKLEYESMKNELAKKYPVGVTEEIVEEGKTKITKRIVVIGNKGVLYEKKETGFGATYYFKDGVAISEQTFEKDTKKK